MNVASAPFAPFLSEQVAEALRAGDQERVRKLSPYAASITPLLNALGWRSSARDIIESLPHFAARLELGDLRNMLVTLGYQSDAKQVNLATVDTNLLPCLFVTASGQVYVVKDGAGEQLSYFDAQSGTHESGRLDKRGTAYLFTETNALEQENRGSEWFSRLAVRFKALIRHLLAMTFVLNLITMLVPLFMMIMYDRVIGTRSLEALPFLVGGMVFALAIELAMRLLRARTLGLIAGRLDYLIGVETFRQIVHLPPQYTERSTVSKQLSTLRQFDGIRDFFTGNAASLALEAPFVLMFIAAIGVIGGLIALVPVVMIGLYILFASLWLPSMNRKVTRAGTARTGYAHLLMETFAGLRELKSLSVESVWRSRLRESSADALTAVYRTAVGQAVLENVAYTLTTLAGVCVLALGTHQVMDGSMTVGALIAVMALLWRVLGPIQGLFLTYVKFDHVVLGVRTLNQLMKLKPERSSGKSALLSPRMRGALRFDRLSFRYSPGADPVLLGASFALEPGEFLAILGQNGGGKSTILKLLAGMYTAQSGNAYIDDIDTRQFNPMDLRRLVAYVPQNPKLFHGTIAQNLRLKDIMATDAELEAAAFDAGVLEMVRELPQGFETRIGDKDTERLPSGLVHGLCLARAFLSAAPVVLLDEPGATLDRDGDTHLIEQLKHLKGRRTIVMVSHRPSHIRLADKALVIHRGMVQFIGPPQEALSIIDEAAHAPFRAS